MSIHHPPPAVRRLVRAAALAPAIGLLTLAAPALADAPDTWPAADRVSALHMLAILVLIPASCAVVITLLVYVPSLVRGQRNQPGLSWRNEIQWFGGPTEGVEATDKVEPAEVAAGHDSRGGASARW